LGPSRPTQRASGTRGRGRRRPASSVSPSRRPAARWRAIRLTPGIPCRPGGRPAGPGRRQGSSTAADAARSRGRSWESVRPGVARRPAERRRPNPSADGQRGAPLDPLQKNDASGRRSA
jgi:hypothetical protein